jgi:hypothetical protein
MSQGLSCSPVRRRARRPRRLVSRRPLQPRAHGWRGAPATSDDARLPNDPRTPALGQARDSGQERARPIAVETASLRQDAFSPVGQEHGETITNLSSHSNVFHPVGYKISSRIVVPSRVMVTWTECAAARSSVIP